MQELAWLILVVLIGAVVLNLIEGGPDQAREWLATKFVGTKDTT